MSNFKQKLIRFGRPVLFVLLAAAIIAPFTQGKTKPYYQGDAINYQGRLLIASTNMNRLQVMETADKQINLLAEIKPDKSGYLPGDDFYNCAFHQEAGRLFLYAVNGRYMYKYDASKPSQPELVNKLTDNSWDWFQSVAVFNDHIVTSGTKGIKIWNNDLQVIDSLNLKLSNANNFTISHDFLFAVTDGQFRIFNLRTRQWTKSVNLTIKDDSNRQLYNDPISSTIYVADDWAVKQFDFEGNLIDSFRFTGNNGYDVVPSTNGQSIYASDGIGVVRLTKSGLRPDKWAYVREMGVSDGWSMGLRLVDWQGSDHLVVFNSGAVSVLNNQLKTIANHRSSEEEVNNQPAVSEPLALNLDKNRASVGGQVSLRGTGFLANEKLEIRFLSNGRATSSVTTDLFGRFQKTLTVPAITNPSNNTVNPLPTDIKVVGQTSQRSYSINFQIEN